MTYEPIYVYRVQDDNGRGPYKPGISIKWVDDHGPPPPKTWMEEFGDIRRKVMPYEHCGSACETLSGLRNWFTPTEAKKIQALGYSIARMKASRILARSESQVFFTRGVQLKKDIEIIPWNQLYP